MPIPEIGQRILLSAVVSYQTSENPSLFVMKFTDDASKYQTT